MRNTKFAVYMRICVVFKRRCRKFGPEYLESVNKGYIRNAFTLFGNTLVARAIVERRGPVYRGMRDPLK